LLNRLVKGLLLSSALAMDTDAQDRHAAERTAMLEEVARDTWETRRETGRGELSRRVMEALGRVPRHSFIPAEERPHAYRNRPLSIGQGQTISQPFIVALMTELLDLKPGDRVLEIGTGSGYQSAVLAELGANVYTLEIIESLGREATARLAALGYKSVTARIADGYLGWPEHAPFDAIIVTAAAPDVPNALAQQLKVGGRLVIPVGSPAGAQTLYLMTKEADGQLTRRAVLAVRFVPMVPSASTPQSR